MARENPAFFARYRRPLVALAFSLAFPLAAAAEPAPASALTLEAALEHAIGSNQELAATSAGAEAEHAMIRAQYAPAMPMFGLMFEKNTALMGEPGGMAELGSMTSWTLSQEFRFPAKYFLLGSAQRSKARSADLSLSSKRLEIRRKVISAYYRLFALGRIRALLQANLDAARNTARAAEARRSTGEVMIQDEMKAHVEETKVNSELLMVEEERQMAENELALLLGEPGSDGKLALPAKELPIPTLQSKPEEIVLLARGHSRFIQRNESELERARTRKSLAVLEYLPDFKLLYSKPLGSDAPSGSHVLGVEFSVPLWFFLGQSAEVSAASAESAMAQRMRTQAELETASMVRSLIAKSSTRHTLLKIYETALIPQATSTFNSSEAAYRAGRTSLLDHLDSQRALFETRIAYYRTLADYVDALAELEAQVGASVSALPLPPEKL
ncbi:MAG: TolC family protein [Oligoflexia bacterium]|nr:TolC family protein [Oligoflexia bacterium]